MSRNFGLGSKNMTTAARNALSERTRDGFSTVATQTTRFSQFTDFAKQNGIGRMERISPELVQQYGQGLADKVENGELCPAYAQNLVSAVNSVMSAATRGEWKSVSPTKDCHIPERDNVRHETTIQREQIQSGLSTLDPRAAVIGALANDLGLRSKEASLLDAKTALNQAETRGVLSVSDGTKGGRYREVTITNERQLQTLERAAEVQGDNRAVMPGDTNWKEWREGGLRDARESIQSATGARGIHDLRSSYACERYDALTGNQAPCNGGQIEDKQLDREAREQIARELGHGRIDVVSSYIGGR